MAASAQISNINHRHVGISDWLLVNPDRTLTDCARELGFTITWVSVIVNSDAFKHFHAERQQQYYDERIAPLRDKLVGVTTRAVERLGEAVEESRDANFLLAAADKTLGRLGYGAKAPTAETPSGPVMQQYNFFADKETLQRAREKMINGAAQMPSAAALPVGGENNLGEFIPQAPALLSED